MIFKSAYLLFRVLLQRILISAFLLLPSRTYNSDVPPCSLASFESLFIKTYNAVLFYNHHPLKSPRQAPIIFNKSLLNVYNRFCSTNCLKCFPHFHMLTHSLKISCNPSLVAGFSFSSKHREIRTRERGGTKCFKQTLKRLKWSKITFRNSSCLPGNSWPAFFICFSIKRQGESRVPALHKATRNQATLFFCINNQSVQFLRLSMKQVCVVSAL